MLCIMVFSRYKLFFARIEQGLICCFGIAIEEA